MSKNRMFNFVARTWNPVVGCTHNCTYCWARRQAKRLKRICELCYEFIPHLHEDRLDSVPSPKDGIVFVTDMGDLFCNDVDSTWISRVLVAISRKVAENRNTLYFLETKNPSRYFEFVDKYYFMDKLIFSTTIETDIVGYASMYSAAPTTYSRYISIKAFHREYPDAKVHLSIEPILDFNFKSMLKWIIDIDPSFGISIGYDNYNNKLKEPKQEKVEKLIELLESLGYRVERKTIRQAWHMENMEKEVEACGH